jgi:hypothetical protein
MFAFFKKLFARADVNKDGRVDAKDAAVAVEAVKATAKTTAVRAKATVKKAAVQAKSVRAKKAPK